MVHAFVIIGSSPVSFKVVYSSVYNHDFVCRSASAGDQTGSGGSHQGQTHSSGDGQSSFSESYSIHESFLHESFSSTTPSIQSRLIKDEDTTSLRYTEAFSFDSKSLLDQIIDRVMVVRDHNRLLKARSPFGQLATLLDTYVVAPDYETGGLFPFVLNNDSKATVLWHAMYGCVYILILEDHENITLAIRILKILLHHLQEYFPIRNQALEIKRKPEIVAALLNTYLPQGQLLFMHHQNLVQFDKKMVKLVSKK